MHAFPDSPTSAKTTPRRLEAVPGPASRGSEPMQTIACYEDYRRALAAVTELCGSGKRPRGLHLASGEFETVEVRADPICVTRPRSRSDRRSSVPAGWPSPPPWSAASP